MQFSNHRSRAARGSIVYLAVDAIAPSAVQPRQNFSPAQLEELSRSIAEYGVLSPLTVRPRQGGYELVACLLYTSPSPRDRQKSRMPSSA